jgi:antitoxin component of MazEF toxin-antitoxin module
MSFIIKSILLLCIYTTSTYALDIKKIAKELNLKAGTKASVQWKRVFSSPRHMKRYKVDTLDERTRELLKSYLIQHAADSDQPIVPGL